MKFSEYINSNDLVKHPPFSVEIDADFYDEVVHIHAPIKLGLETARTVSIMMFGTWHVYRTDDSDDGCLYTMDDDGNKKNSSVFKLINFKHLL